MSSKFNFFQNWYPLSPVEDLDPERPTPVTLLGLNLVIWKPKSSQTYQVFLDQCPHRLAPLSEGRIDEKTGNLMCSYHGWQFDEQGICTTIPQAEKPEIISKNKQNFCVRKFPTQEANDLLWVWADPNSSEQAANTPLPLSPQIDASQGFVWSSYVRDLEYDWQTLVENVADPSHVPFAHHGVQGNRNQAIPIPIKIIQSTASLIEAKTQGRFNTTITFEAPCRLEYAIEFGTDGKQVGLVTYCLPVSPGKSRIVAQFPRNFAKTLHRIIPRWWTHIKTRNLVLDGDMIFLHQQERFLQQKQQTESWKTAYKLPTEADHLVIEFRKWFDQYSQGKLPWEEVGISQAETLSLPKTRREILDRYHQHTQHCSSCRGALKAVKRWQIGLIVYFAIALSSAAILPDHWRLTVGLPLVITALASLGIYAGLKYGLEPQFYFIDYIHAEKK
ncbi:Rieske 2Fe-2S domain-containing protein [Limnoraphis robusta Tam1]|uniref:aromatic ring-hydroxylating dioxygenase subunit alpha n=1 Tax=Limnoraphis robusta TaxID=1118279 RepID=UPI002B1EF698|nr:Rieske 2Fe-2S domain-containing protein [Limnoraphis robusta]MEA5496565.1 Rieske 2Fe-2S domain-containing protein [Limnoraphis robusta BA-68 BA1]MEA5539723.1 Rieske 2Fe-2S domain-containing protein [Limnoraphis robusta Tam1]